jgi:hypothetical protein
MDGPCPQCGEPATESLTLWFSYPRRDLIPSCPDAMRFTGTTVLLTCGSPGCETAEVLAAATEVMAVARQQGGHEAISGFAWMAARTGDMTRTEHGNGTFTLSWPDPPKEAW